MINCTKSASEAIFQGCLQVASAIGDLDVRSGNAIVANHVYRFGDIDFDPGTFKLHRGGEAVQLERRPAQLLALLLAEPGRLVSREQIIDCLWGTNIHVEADLGVNTAMRKLRRALGDRTAEPSFIETVPRLGYRFLARVVMSPAVDADRHLIIAVLPFQDLGPNGQAQYLADGFTDETIARLGQIDPGHLSVVGRTSITTFTRDEPSLVGLRSRFGVDYFVESSLRAERDRLRVICKLVDLSDQRQVWAETYEGAPTRVLAFQESISRTIATRIRLHLTPSHARLAARRQSENPTAFDLYLQGRFFFNQNTRQTNGQAIGCYRQAVALDPHYALAWAGLAETLGVNPVNGDVEPALVAKAASEAANRAVQHGPLLAETYAARGFVRFWLEWNWLGAEVDFRQAVALDPNYAFARRMLGVALSHLGLHEEAQSSIRLACELDPHLPMHHALASQVSFQARDYTQAVEHARHATMLAPGFWIGHHMLAQAYERLGDLSRTLLAADTAIALTGGNAKTLAVKGFALAQAGQDVAAHTIIAERAAASAERYVPPFTEAAIYAGFSDLEASCDALERSLAVRDVNLAFLPSDPKWDPLRAHSRFQTIIGRAGFTLTSILHAPATQTSVNLHAVPPANDDILSA